MDAGVATRYLAPQILPRQFLGTAERFAIWHDLGNYSPMVRGGRGNRLRIQQECLRSTRTGAIAPRREDPVARHNTAREMGRVVERCAFCRHNYVGKQGILGVHMCAALNRCDHWHAYVGDILYNLNAFIMNLAPDTGIGDVAEGREIDTGDEVATCSGQDHDLVRPILRDPVESVDELGVVLRRESERAAVGMKLGDQDAFGVSRQVQAAVGAT